MHQEKPDTSRECNDSPCNPVIPPHKARRGRPGRMLRVNIEGTLKVAPVVVELLAQEIQKWNE